MRASSGQIGVFVTCRASDYPLIIRGWVGYRGLRRQLAWTLFHPVEALMIAALQTILTESSYWDRKIRIAILTLAMFAALC